MLTLDAALGFRHEGVFVFQVLLNQLAYAVGAFASEIYPAETQNVSLADIYHHVFTDKRVYGYPEQGPSLDQETLTIL